MGGGEQSIWEAGIIVTETGCPSVLFPAIPKEVAVWTFALVYRTGFRVQPWRLQTPAAAWGGGTGKSESREKQTSK